MSILSANRFIMVLVLPIALASSGQPTRAQMQSREAIALQNQLLDLQRQVQAATGPGRTGRWRSDLSGSRRIPSANRWQQ